MTIAPCPFAALLILPALCPAAAALGTTPRGTFTLERQAGDGVNRAIEAAVARTNVVTRLAMRGRLRRTNPAYGRVVINYDQRPVSVSFDDRRPMESPAGGTPVRWTREDGERFDLRTEWQSGRLVQTFKGEGRSAPTPLPSRRTAGR